MRIVLLAMLWMLVGSASAAFYPCPAPVSLSQAACIVASPGGTTTYIARGHAQVRQPSLPSGVLPAGPAAVALLMSVDALPCNENFGIPVAIASGSTAVGVNGSCTFTVTSKRPAEVILSAVAFDAINTGVSLTVESIAFVPDATLDVSIVGNGTVTSADGLINCGADCTETYGLAPTITLSAVAGSGSVFTGWGGACTGTSATCTLLMNESKNVTATFGAGEPATVIEFYNTLLNHYFITANPDEVAAIDNGSAGPGWSRTGYWFRTGGNVPVCRFYGSLTPGPNSHFYTAIASECNFLKSQEAITPASQPRWNFEGLAFATTLPVNGRCPGTTVPVYRAYNNGFLLGIDSNHRITSSPNALQHVIDQGWRFEGIVMCAPQ